MNAAPYGHLLSSLTDRIDWSAAQRPSNEMRRLVGLERDRCDRGGPGFALLELRPSDGPRGKKLATGLRDYVGGRIRHVDVLGVIEDALVILLPNTSRRGALRLAQDICEGYQHQQPLRYVISIYPETPGTGAQIRPRTPAQEDRVNASSIDRLVEAARGSDMVAGPGSPQSLHWLVESHMPIWKRSLDMVGAVGLLIASAPVVLLSILHLQLRDPGPILFRQQRIGHLGRPFSMLKLRTMRCNADEASHQEYLRQLMRTNEPLTKLDQSGDQRLIPGAALIRSLGIDELAQLVNVIKGEMSLVGPRPCLPYEASAFDQWHHARFQSPPGLTGLWQVSGKNRTTFREMMALDVRYTRALRPWRDLTILWRTIPAVLAYARS